MNFSLKDRHLFGVGAAACAVCCAAPILTVLGVAGAAATVATFVFAGVVFGVVVAIGAGFAVWNQRRRQAADPNCAADQGPQDIEIMLTPPAQERRPGSPR